MGARRSRLALREVRMEGVEVKASDLLEAREARVWLDLGLASFSMAGSKESLSVTGAADTPSLEAAEGTGKESLWERRFLEARWRGGRVKRVRRSGLAGLSAWNEDSMLLSAPRVDSTFFFSVRSGSDWCRRVVMGEGGAFFVFFLSSFCAFSFVASLSSSFSSFFFLGQKEDFLLESTLELRAKLGEDGPVGVVGAEAEDGGIASRGLGDDGVEKDGKLRLKEKTDFQLVGMLYICKKKKKKTRKNVSQLIVKS